MGAWGRERCSGAGGGERSVCHRAESGVGGRGRCPTQERCRPDCARGSGETAKLRPQTARPEQLGPAGKGRRAPPAGRVRKSPLRPPAPGPEGRCGRGRWPCDRDLACRLQWPRTSSKTCGPDPRAELLARLVAQSRVVLRRPPPGALGPLSPPHGPLFKPTVVLGLRFPSSRGGACALPLRVRELEPDAPGAGPLSVEPPHPRGAAQREAFGEPHPRAPGGAPVRLLPCRSPQVPYDQAQPADTGRCQGVRG